MTRHIIQRAPRANGGFSWGRVLSDGKVGYRLFRRDHKGALHMSISVFTHEQPRADVASTLRRARRSLRDKVDEIDLAAMDVAA